jgi:Ca-activated chloride channel family protein
MSKPSFDWARVILLVVLLLVLSAAAVVYPLGSHGREWLEVTWHEPLWLWGLVLLPLILFRSTYGRDRRTARLKIGTLKGFQRGPRGLRARLVDLPGVARTVGLAFCILALARPVSVLRPSVSEEEGIDLVVTLDLSGSMEAVMENLPKDLERYVEEKGRGVPPNRLDAAKAVLRDFISRRQSDRIGAVVFGRNAYVVSPPTLDYQLLDTLIARMELKLIDPRGTAIGDALGVAVARLRNSSAKSKAVVLLTDGDNQHGTVAPEYAAHLANKMGVKVFTIQIGEGELAKVFAGFDLFGQPRFEKVPYPTNPELLKKLASLTGGSMYVAKDAKNLQASFHDVLNKLEKTEFEAAQASYEDLFRFLLFPGVVLIFFEALLAATWLRRFP